MVTFGGSFHSRCFSSVVVLCVIDHGLIHSDFCVCISKAHPLNSWAIFVGVAGCTRKALSLLIIRACERFEIRAGGNWTTTVQEDAFHISYMWQHGLGSVFMSGPNKQSSKVHSLAPGSSVPKPCDSHLVAWPTEHCHWAAPYPSQPFLGNLLRYTGGGWGE